MPKILCVPTELIAFRKRIGEPGVELILQESIRVNDPPEDNNEGIVVSVDTTVREKNITLCYSKGKEHKKFEFGSKDSIVVDQATGIIMGAINFTETLHDSKTLPEVLEQFERLNRQQAKEVIVDRGYKGLKTYKVSKI